MPGPLPPVADVIRLVLIGDQNGQAINNILHWVFTGSNPTDVSIGNIAEAVFDAWVARFAGFTNSVFNFDGVIATDLSSSTGATNGWHETTPGATTGDPLPNSTAAVVRYNTPLRYRGGHPRNYLCGYEWSQLNDTRTWSSGFRTAVQTAWAGLIADINAISDSGTTMDHQCAVSYVTAHAPRVTPLVLPLTFTDCAPRVCTQRRRLGKAGG